MATTQFGVNHPLSNKLYAKQLFYDALKATQVSQAGVIGKGSDSILQLFEETKKDAGDQVTYGLRTLLTGDGVSGDSTLEGNEEALSFYHDSFVIDQIRHATRSAGKMSEQRVPYAMRDEAKMALADWFADKFDTSFFNQITGNTNITNTKNTGNNTVTAPDAAHWILATGVAGTDAEASLSASSTFSLTLIDRAIAKAKVLAPQIRPLRIGGENKYVCFIHPYQHHQLRINTNTAQYMDIQKAALQGGQISKNPIYTGALAEYNGVILKESTRVPWGTIAQDANSKTTVGVTSVTRAVLCGAQAGVIGFGKDSNTGLQANWTEETFDFGNQLGVAGGVIYGLKKSIFNSKDFGTIVISSFSPDPNA